MCLWRTCLSCSLIELLLSPSSTSSEVGSESLSLEMLNLAAIVTSGEIKFNMKTEDPGGGGRIIGPLPVIMEGTVVRAAMQMSAEESNDEDKRPTISIFPPI